MIEQEVQRKIRKTTIQRIKDDLVVERDKLDMRRKRFQDMADEVNNEMVAITNAIEALNGANSNHA